MSHFGSTVLHGFSVNLMKVLISGATGYLGGRIANYLTREGVNVVRGGRAKTKIVTDGSDTNIIKLGWYNFEKLVENCNGFDVVIHSAGMNAKDCIANPEGALSFNGEETGNFVRASAKAGVKKFIYLSTVHVYSSPLIGNYTEKDTATNQHPYAYSNLIGEEKVIEETTKATNTKGIILRLSNAVGSPIHKEVNCWDLVVNDLCKQVIEKNKIKILSRPSIERDFFPIIFLEKTIHKFLFEKNIFENIFNFCSSNSMTLQHTAELVRERAKKRLKIDVDIEYSNLSCQEKDDYLHISNDTLKNYMPIENNLDEEIDLLLSNCQQWFK